MLQGLRSSKGVQSVLIVAAAAASLFPLVAKGRQGNSIRWTADGEQIHCEYYQLPSFSHVRSYDPSKINGITTAPDSQDDSVEVVRLQLNGLNLNIPSQSDAVISDFDDYVSGLQVFLAHVKGGDVSRTFTWRQPWMVAGVVSAALGAALWVLVFTVLLLGPPKTGPHGSAG